MTKRRYQANFTKGSLLIPESRTIARLLMDHPSAEAWERAVVEHNILQKRTLHSATTLANLIRHRLEAMPEALWSLVVEGPPDTVRQGLLAAMVKHSTLLGDFMLLVLKDLFLSFEERLNPLAWERYLEERYGQHPEMPRWAESTMVKLRQTGLRALVEAEYLSDAQSLKLKKVFLTPEIVSCLQENRENYALSCLQVCP